jgi:hypothetical protein
VTFWQRVFQREPMVPLAWHDAQVKRLWSQYDALLARIPVTQAPPVSRETPVTLDRPQAVDPILELIDAKCGSDYRKRAMMLRQLAADRAAGVSQEDILAAIEYGVGSRGIPE